MRKKYTIPEKSCQGAFAKKEGMQRFKAIFLVKMVDTLIFYDIINPRAENLTGD
jgi:hypothetical protein